MALRKSAVLGRFMTNKGLIDTSKQIGTRAVLSTGPTYTERMAKTGRPVSPHVQIFAFPIAAISSITNRVSGVAPLAKFVVAFPLVYHYLGGVRHVIWDNKPE